MKLPKRFRKKFEIRGAGCWEWTAATVKGYGQYHLRGTGGERVRVLAHRYTYSLMYGEIPEGWHVHHACKNKLCVRPSHLQAVTPKAHKALNPATHCGNGHPFDETNTRQTKRQRHCRKCQAEASRRYRTGD